MHLVMPDIELKFAKEEYSDVCCIALHESGNLFLVTS